jgi:hypothetical protein
MLNTAFNCAVNLDVSGASKNKNLGSAAWK